MRSKYMEVMIEKARKYIAYKVDDKLKKIDERLAKETVKRDLELLSELNREKQDRITNADIAEWLDKNCPKGGSLSKASHGPKYSHGYSKATAVFVDEHSDESLVTTSCIPDLDVDFVGDGAVSAVAGLLRLRSEGKWFFEYIVEREEAIFSAFSSDTTKIADWIDGLSKALLVKEVRSHSLAKQIYFPVEESYHLLSPLYASCLSQEITNKIRHQLFSENAKDARDARKNSQPSDLPIVNFPKLGIVEYGGSQPQNISRLNLERGGRGYLLNCQPPTWRSKSKLPETSHQFWRQLERKTWMTLKELRVYLEKHQSSLPVRRIKDPINEKVNAIVESFFMLTVNIRLLGQEQGGSSSWSDQMEFTPALALLLNPERAELDAEFREVRELKEWPGEIGKEFGTWLNQQLKTDDLNFGDTERDHWAKIIKNTVSRLRDDLHYFQENV